MKQCTNKYTYKLCIVKGGAQKAMIHDDTL